MVQLIVIVLICILAIAFIRFVMFSGWVVYQVLAQAIAGAFHAAFPKLGANREARKREARGGPPADPARRLLWANREGPYSDDAREREAWEKRFGAQRPAHPVDGAGRPHANDAQRLLWANREGPYSDDPREREAWVKRHGPQPPTLRDSEPGDPAE